MRVFRITNHAKGEVIHVGTKREVKEYLKGEEEYFIHVDEVDVSFKRSICAALNESAKIGGMVS